jgi:hypothetical protein
MKSKKQSKNIKFNFDIWRKLGIRQIAGNKVKNKNLQKPQVINRNSNYYKRRLSNPNIKKQIANINQSDLDKITNDKYLVTKKFKTPIKSKSNSIKVNSLPYIYSNYYGKPQIRKSSKKSSKKKLKKNSKKKLKKIYIKKSQPIQSSKNISIRRLKRNRSSNGSLGGAKRSKGGKYSYNNLLNKAQQKSSKRSSNNAKYIYNQMDTYKPPDFIPQKMSKRNRSSNGSLGGAKRSFGGKYSYNNLSNKAQEKSSKRKRSSNGSLDAKYIYNQMDTYNLYKPPDFIPQKMSKRKRSTKGSLKYSYHQLS